jgi:hypothetical protein
MDLNRSRGGVGILLGTLVLTCATVAADIRPSRRDAQMLRQKVSSIVEVSTRPGRTARRTTVTENEVNSYLAFDARDTLPTGVVDPTITILGGGQVSGRAVVDLDAVRKHAKPTSWFDPTSYLTGRLPVTAIGTLRTNNGIGRFELASATVGGVPVPKILLQQIVSYYSRTPANPAGIGLDDHFALPARIREIQVERGQAIVVQ